MVRLKRETKLDSKYKVVYITNRINEESIQVMSIGRGEQSAEEKRREGIE